MNHIEVSQSPGLWQSVWQLLYLRILILLRGIRRAKLRKKIGYAFLLLLGLGLIAFSIFLTWGFLRLINSPTLQQALREQAEYEQFLNLFTTIPVLITSGAFIVLLLTSFGVLLQALYLAKDMDFLLAVPLPMRSVFLAKMIQSLLPNLGLVCLFGLPILFGLGAAWHYHWIYYPLVVVVMIALALIASGLASLLVMAVVRVFPARRVAEVIGFVGAIATFICSQSGNLMRFENVTGDQAMQTLTLVERYNQAWLPLTWAGRGLSAVGERNWLEGLGLLFLVLGSAALVFWLSLAACERLYYSGWSSLQGVTKQRKPRPKTDPGKSQTLVVQLSTSGSSGAGVLGAGWSTNKEMRQERATWMQRILPTPVLSLASKDMRVLRRDLRNLSQLVTPLIFGLMYGIVLLKGGDNIFQGSGQAPEMVLTGLRSLSVFGGVLLALFVSWSLVARLAGMGFSAEGVSYWIVKAAPVPVGQLIWAKFLVAYLPTLLLSSVYLVIVSLLQTQSLRLLPFTLPAVALIIAGDCGINLAFGIVGARLDWQDPRHMQRFSTGCLSALATLAYMLVSALLFFGPALGAEMLNIKQVWGLFAGLVFGGSLALVCAILPPILVKERVKHLGG
jgi:ABC-2 type transport system permease protein